MSGPRRSTRIAPGTLAAAFAARRHELGLTQSELSLLANVGRSTVQSIESGSNSVQLDGAIAIAEALGCDLGLLTRAGTIVSPR